MVENNHGMPMAQRSQRLLQQHNPSSFWIQLAVDGIICIALLFVLTMLRNHKIDFQYRVLGSMALLLMWIFHNHFGVYRRRSDTIGVAAMLTKSWISISIALTVIGFATKTSEDFSRQVILSWIPFCIIFQFAAHHITPDIIKKIQGTDSGREASVIIGAGNLGCYLADRINNNHWLNIKIVGVLDDDEQALKNWNLQNVPALGAVKELPRIIEELHIVSVYIAMPIVEKEKLETLYMSLLEKNIDINWAPDIFQMTLINPSVKELAGVPILALSETPLIGSKALLKSTVDKTLALIAIIMTSPIMLAVALAIKLSSPGPILFKQKRLGWNEAVFEIWKFRSMYVTSEPEGVVTQATRDDPRITPVGKFLRRTSLDELPQLFNVLQGTMSMVGPRPHAVEHDDQYSRVINTYFARHRIKPGITGLAQVSGYRGETETIDKMAKRVELDMEYINNWSIALDLKILARTFFVLLSKNAY